MPLHTVFGIWIACTRSKLEVYHMKVGWGHPLISLLSCFMYSLLFIMCSRSYSTFFSIHWNLKSLNALKADWTSSAMQFLHVLYWLYKIKGIVFFSIYFCFLPFLQRRLKLVWHIHYAKWGNFTKLPQTDRFRRYSSNFKVNMKHHHSQIYFCNVTHFNVKQDIWKQRRLDFNHLALIWL